MKDTAAIEKLRKRIWVTALVVYIASMFCPTFCNNARCPDQMLFDGLFTTLSGWMGAFFIGGIYMVWFSNPLFIIGLIINKRSPISALIVSVSALTISLVFLGGGKVLLNEAGHYGYVTKLLIGYWIWMLSMWLLVAASITSVIKH